MFEIGSSLREARLRQGLDFPELEQATKIRGKYLHALEEEQFDVLPAQTYVKGFLRSYADYLGLDGQLYVDEFTSRYVGGEDDSMLRPRRRAPGGRREDGGRHAAQHPSGRRRLNRPRAVLVITGSELVRGDRTDLNGPFLAREVLRLGLDPARIEIVGDREDELEEALRAGMRADLCVVSGGLGPTHDDRTVELVARAANVELRLDEALHREIGAVSRAFAERTGRPYADFEHGVRKQATVPAGASSLGLAGTAPGLVLESPNGAVVVLPGPPAELQRLWPRALETDAVRGVLTR